MSVVIEAIDRRLAHERRGDNPRILGCRCQNGPMAAAPHARMRSDLKRLLHHGTDLNDYALEAARILAPTFGFDGFCLLTLDPATLLPTGEIVQNGLPPYTRARMAEIEMSGEDVSPFAVLGRSPGTVATLSQETGGHLDRSLRHRELRAPNGFGDELRVALATDGTTWGALTLLRGADRGDFTAPEARLVASVSGLLAEGLRRAMLLEAIDGDTEPAPAGVALIAGDGSVVKADQAGGRWLAELAGADDDGLPPAVAAVDARARAAGRHAVDDGPVARVRIWTRSGRWLLVRASVLGDGDDALTAVLIEPLSAADLAPLVATAHGLSEREREVTQLVARGLSTTAIAERLFLSSWTVQDHLKRIFAKLGVSNRGELVAQVFFKQGAPPLTDALQDPGTQATPGLRPGD
jgi:DNA-binding CsgD family transcriptional regulator